eukprot:1463297-Pleurochrysis_carterae.AAC.2
MNKSSTLVNVTSEYELLFVAGFGSKRKHARIGGGLSETVLAQPGEQSALPSAARLGHAQP